MTVREGVGEAVASATTDVKQRDHDTVVSGTKLGPSDGDANGDEVDRLSSMVA